MKLCRIKCQLTAKSIVFGETTIPDARDVFFSRGKSHVIILKSVVSGSYKSKLNTWTHGPIDTGRLFDKGFFCVINMTN